MKKNIIALGVSHQHVYKQDSRLISNDLLEEVHDYLQTEIGTSSSPILVITEDPNNAGLITDKRLAKRYCAKIGFTDSDIAQKIHFYSSDMRFNEYYLEIHEKMQHLQKLFGLYPLVFEHTVQDDPELFLFDLYTKGVAKGDLVISNGGDDKYFALGLLPYLKLFINESFDALREQPEREWMDVAKRSNYRKTIIIGGMHHAVNLQKQYGIPTKLFGAEKFVASILASWNVQIPTVQARNSIQAHLLEDVDCVKRLVKHLEEELEKLKDNELQKMHNIQRFLELQL